MSRRILVFLALLTLVLPLLAADVTGTWTADVKSDAGSGNPVFVLKQQGEALTGTYSGQLGDAAITGTIKGDDVRFQFDVGASIVYTGKLDASGTKMSGSVDLAGQATGTFTAEKAVKR